LSQAVLEKLKAKFGEEVILDTHAHRGDETAVVRPDAIRDVCIFLKDDPDCAFEMIMDVTGVDWPSETPRLEVVYHLYSLTKKHRIRLKSRVPVEDPKLPSVTPVWIGASWFEREAYDMYGVVFDGHPDLRRILLYPEFVGHPLRKDYPLNGEQPLTELRDPETQRPVMPGYGADLVQIGGSSKRSPEET
jgi:NADH-quinone oxidoreductase subunit C